VHAAHQVEEGKGGPNYATVTYMFGAAGGNGRKYTSMDALVTRVLHVAAAWEATGWQLCEEGDHSKRWQVTHSIHPAFHLVTLHWSGGHEQAAAAAQACSCVAAAMSGLFVGPLLWIQGRHGPRAA
jgi:hypothetical protein